MITSVEKGIYSKSMGGRTVNPATGNFNFAVMEGYLIETGRIKSPVRWATLIGSGSEILKKIEMVGNNLAYGQGMCGSVSGSICTNVGQPAVKVVMEGYLIENGKITSPVRGATLIGSGSEILKKIEMVGNNLAYGQGMCGSVSGSICTNVGQPAVKVSEITVGGRK